MYKVRFNALYTLLGTFNLTNKDNRMIDLRLGDCLEVMKTIESGSIDAVICDLPYNTTNAKWDKTLHLDKLWVQYNRIIKVNGVVILTAQQPFTSALIMSNPKMFNHNWTWEKDKCANFQLAKYQPLKTTEDILIVTKGGFTYDAKNKCTYNPIMTSRKPRKPTKETKRSNKMIEINPRPNPTSFKSDNNFIADKNYPKNLIYFKTEHKNRLHPTQKPLSLMEYLIKTYTNENDLILDNTMGSGSTMVACKNLNRQGIGIEKEEKYFKIAQERVNSTLF